MQRGRDAWREAVMKQEIKMHLIKFKILNEIEVKILLYICNTSTLIFFN